MTVVTLLLFERASRGGASFRWDAGAAAGLALSAWTKYQAVCVCIAIAIYCGYVIRENARVGLRRLARPVLLQLIAGVGAIGLLMTFFLLFGGGPLLRDTLGSNAQRMFPAQIGVKQAAHAMLFTAGKSARALGPVFLMASCLAIFVQSRQRDLLVLLTAYVLVSLAFNIVFFELPGSGSYYLPSMIPAMAILAGASAGALESLGINHRNAITATAASVQLLSVPSPVHLQPYVNAPRLAAAYIASEGRSSAGVLAESEAIGFYNNSRVGIIPFTDQQDVLSFLADAGPGDVQFVVVERAEPFAGVEKYRDVWERLLRDNFVIAHANVPDLIVYQRRSRAR